MSAPETVIDPADPPVLGANPFVGLTRRQVGAATRRLLRRMAVEPGVVLADGMEATGELVKVMIGRSRVEPAAGDKRFTHPTWSSNPMYRRLVQAYLVQTRALLGVVDDVELDAKSRERARFAVSLFTEAVAPTNTLAGNPAAMGTAVQTRGRSLVRGARHFVQDARHNNWMPSTVDRRPFSVGGNVAVTPGQVVHRSEVFELIQYAPSTDTTRTRPLVAIPPQINKFYIEDIAPGRSLIEHTVAARIPYFAISWRNPTAEQRDWNLDTYVAACKEAVEVACDITGSPDVNTLGICAGGITMACLLGHLAAVGEPLVNAATFMVAGLDTSVESMIGMFASSATVEAARARSQRAGVLDGKDMAAVFAWLRPNDLVWNYWVNNYLLGQDPPAFDILYWNSDTTRLPAGLHSDFLDLYGSNGLARPGTLIVLGTPVDLSKVSVDTYVVAGSTDHIIPWTAAYRTTQLVGGTTEFVLSSSGHIQAIVNPPSNARSSYLTRAGVPPPTAEEWLEGATRQPGSWWDHWTTWLAAHSGEERAAPVVLGNADHPALGPAPGRYVHLQ